MSFFFELVGLNSKSLIQLLDILLVEITRTTKLEELIYRNWVLTHKLNPMLILIFLNIEDTNIANYIACTPNLIFHVLWAGREEEATVTGVSVSLCWHSRLFPSKTC